MVRKCPDCGVELEGDTYPECGQVFEEETEEESEEEL